MLDPEEIDISQPNGYDTFYLEGGFKYDLNWALKFLQEQTTLTGSSGTLLDLACGDGVWAHLLAQWYDVTGEDTCKGGIYMARKKALELNNGAKFYVADSLAETKPYDVIFTRAPSFLSNKPPEDADFQRGLECTVERALKKVVFITYSKEPFSEFNEKRTTYYHDPEIIYAQVSRFGPVKVHFAGGYIVAEVSK